MSISLAMKNNLQLAIFSSYISLALCFKSYTIHIEIQRVGHIDESQ